jgi:hypothetical protein
VTAPNNQTHDQNKDGGLERTIELLAAIKAGRTGPGTIAPADRRQLVAFLAADGLSNAEIAQVLQVSDRCVERDKRAIREANAIPKDPRLVAQMVGRLVAEAELCVQRIRRATREKEVEPGVRVDAEHRCFQIVNDLTHTLQRLGYLPTATQRIEADLTHHAPDLPTLDDLSGEVERLKLLAPAGGQGSAAVMIQLEQTLARAVVAAQVQAIKEVDPGEAGDAL